jgi:hypothetical protein
LAYTYGHGKTSRLLKEALNMTEIFYDPMSGFAMPAIQGADISLGLIGVAWSGVILACLLAICLLKWYPAAPRVGVEPATSG